jgi:CDP-diacylglycerol pyrophosphatase
MNPFGPSLLLAVLLMACGVASVCADPNVLWHIVNDRCVPNQQQHDSPAPCASVDLAGGTVVLKDIKGETQYLLLPTARVTGIEDSAILAPGAPNYFAAAWKARAFVDQRAGHTLPRTDIGLVINSEYGRTQNQLHIHVDCLRPDVIAALKTYGPALGTSWTAFPVSVAGESYLARMVHSADLAGINPFSLLADEVPGARADMGRWTLAAAGFETATDPDFILLAGKADLMKGDRASGEGLQDHNCAVKSGD